MNVKCGWCNGEGETIVGEHPQWGGDVYDTCPHCDGSGKERMKWDHVTWFIRTMRAKLHRSKLVEEEEIPF